MISRTEDIRLDPMDSWPCSIMELIGLLTAQGYANTPNWTFYLSATDQLPYASDGIVTKHFKSSTELIEYAYSNCHLPFKGPNPQ